MKSPSKIITLAVCLATPLTAQATELPNVDVSGVKLENYTTSGGKGVTLWYAPGSTCGGNKLSLPTTATAEDHDRLWSLITAAKLSGRRVFFYFNETSPNCDLVSFGLR